MQVTDKWQTNIVANLYNPIVKVMRESTCQKRSVVCILFDGNGQVISMQSSRCNPKDICPRLDVVTNKENYPLNHCKSEHAEVRALKLTKRMPKKALLIGHRFACDDCERLLKSYGIKVKVLGETI